MSPPTHRAVHANPPGQASERLPRTQLVSGKVLYYAVAFTALHFAIAWAAFSYQGGGIPFLFGSADGAGRSAAGQPHAEQVASARASVAESIDLVYAELPPRLADVESRRDLVASCMLLKTRADELGALLADDPGAAGTLSALAEMSGAADDLRAAVESQSFPDAELALLRLDEGVDAWSGAAGDGSD